MKALIVVDIQNDFLPGGPLAVPEGDQVIPVINQLIRQFELVVATQDWHPPGHCSFASAHPGKKIGDVVDVDGVPQVLWPDHCVQNTLGASFPDSLDSDAIDHSVRKGTDPRRDSYSGFFDNGGRHATGLESYLRERGVDACVIVGLATDYCVKFTALDAIRCGFETAVVPAACRAVNLKPDDGADALAEMSSAGIQISDAMTV